MGSDGSVIVRALPGVSDDQAIAKINAVLKQLGLDGVKFTIEKPTETHRHSPEELRLHAKHTHQH